MPVDLTFHKICSLPKLQASLSTTWWSLAKNRNWANSRKTLDSVKFCGGQQLRIPHDHSKRRENRSLCRFFRPSPAMNFITLDEIWSLVSKRPVAHTNGTKEPPHRTLFAPFRWQTEQWAELRDKNVKSQELSKIHGLKRLDWVKKNWINMSVFTWRIRSLELLYLFSLFSCWCWLALPSAKKLPSRFPFWFRNLCNKTMKRGKNETNQNCKKKQ